MQIPSRTEAEAILKEAEKMNPGGWAEHCRYAATAAEMIAARIQGLNSDAAYVMGLLHDIGRRVGICYIRHVIEGYRWMNELGYTDIARICYTHSFPVKEAGSFFGKVDCSQAEYETLAAYLSNADYDDYDRLIQLCDAISYAGGYWLIEKRLMDVMLRYGFNEYTERKIKSFLALKDYFDQKAGCNIYSLLPGIVESTFGFSPSTAPSGTACP